ncbi:hypothetical protein [Acinetobacter radioresistens]|uniref:hypothetical protein n=1 Tax=Acinetobacter radioresistens TaxID=40216 RepID=UPI0009464695|nr:hypothetical protein [Acinetobacter radioresistens]
MQYLKITLAVCGILLFPGCGEEGIYTAGVSLGGSGTGSNPPGENPNPAPPHGGDNEAPPIIIEPPPTIEEPPVIDDRIYKVRYEGKSEDTCSGVRRTMYILDIESGQNLDSQTAIVLRDKLLQDPNIAVQIVIQNQSNNIVYENIQSCQVPFQLKIMDGKILKASQQFSCGKNESVQIYQPFETKVYDFKFNIPKESNQWKLLYKANYYFHDAELKDQHIQCNDLEMPFEVYLN